MSPATASRVGEDEDFRDVKRKQLQTSPATPRVASDISPPSRGGAISMKIPELARVLGGQGRARLAWDAYSIGVDPSLFHSDVVRLGHDDFESILESLPSGRRHQRLGGEALGKLGQTYRHYRNDRSSNAAPAPLSLEGGVASLSHVSTSSDSTTKLLLKLSDGLEIEAVIIPWNGVRSTLCISSQVGCRQGTSKVLEGERKCCTAWKLTHLFSIDFESNPVNIQGVSFVQQVREPLEVAKSIGRILRAPTAFSPL
jgi:hypothetical protein